MRAVAFEAVEWQPYPGQRVSTTQYKCLLRGTAGAPDNYELFMTNYGPGGSQSPRHRHNFEQFRWAVKEQLNFAPDRNIPHSQLGFFPEGAPYGPMRSEPGNQMLILQFGGASGHGYLHNDQLMQGTRRLGNIGEFSKGVFTRYDDAGRKFNKDAYEAVWEHVSGRAIEYPKPRIDVPLVVDPDAYGWIAISGASGVAERNLIVFNERGSAAFQYRLDHGASLCLAAERGIRLLIVLSGRVVVDGGEYGPLSAIELASRSEGRLDAIEPAVILGFRLPHFDA